MSLFHSTEVPKGGNLSNRCLFLKGARSQHFLREYFGRHKIKEEIFRGESEIIYDTLTQSLAQHIAGCNST